VHLYATGYLAFGVKVNRDAKGLMESGKLSEFNRRDGADLGYAESGLIGDKDLYLVTYFESAEPGDDKRIGPRGFSRKNRIEWKRQIEKFLRENKVEAIGEIGLRLLADLDS
jgi:hypothetical protein